MLLKLLIPIFISNLTYAGVQDKLDEQLGLKSKSYVEKEEVLRNKKSLIFKISKELEKIEDERKDIEEKIFLAKRKASNGITNLKIREEIIKKQKKQVHGQLRAIANWYKLGVGDVLLSAKSIKELDRRTYFMKRLLSAQASKLGQYVSDQKDYDAKKNDLKSQIKMMAELKRELQSKERKTRKLRNYHKRILAKASLEQRKILSSIQKLSLKLNEESTKDLRYFIAKKGKLDLPIEVQSWKSFGVYPTKHRRVFLNRSGVKLKSEKKQLVKSVAQGKVAFVGHTEPYGKTVIVDHKDRYYTVYGSLTEVKVKQGQALKDGQGLGTIKSGELLSFEIRKFSEPIDPRSWIKNNSLKMADNKKETGYRKRL